MGLAVKVDFREAVQALLGRRRSQLCAHSTLDELQAYYRGTLPTEHRDQVREHLAVCEDCTTLLLYGVISPAGSDTAELEDAWQRLRSHLRNGNGVRPGRPLADLLMEGPLPLEEALPIALEIGRALARLHAAGRVLGSLRAEDVLIGPDKQARILDLGVAPTQESFEVGYGRAAEEAVVALFCPLSPEQVTGEGFDQRSNLFSFGVLLYEVLTGASPFKDSTPLGTASRILCLDPPSVRELNPEVAPALAALVDRLLAKEPEARPPSAAAVVRDLESIITGASPAEPAPSVDERIERLYDEIIALTQEDTTDDATRNEEVGRAYARLLELQRAEAEQFRDRFEASLDMPIDAGQDILARARALREELEDLASADTAA